MTTDGQSVTDETGESEDETEESEDDMRSPPKGSIMTAVRSRSPSCTVAAVAALAKVEFIYIQSLSYIVSFYAYISRHLFLTPRALNS